VVNFTPQPFFTWEKTAIPIKYDAGWVPQLVWMILEDKKNLFPLPVFEHWTIQSASSCYIQYAIPALKYPYLS
jgi:hypothetical protein